MAELPELGLPAGGRASAQGLNTAPKSSGGSAPGPLDCAVRQASGCVAPLGWEAEQPWLKGESGHVSAPQLCPWPHLSNGKLPTTLSRRPCPSSRRDPRSGLALLLPGDRTPGLCAPCGRQVQCWATHLLWWGLGARQHVAPAASPLPPGPPPLRHACWASRAHAALPWEPFQAGSLLLAPRPQRQPLRALQKACPQCLCPPPSTCLQPQPLTGSGAAES